MRITRFLQWMQLNGVDAFLFEDPLAILYLTGFQLSEGKVLLSFDGCYLCVDERYWQKALLQTRITPLLWHPKEGYAFLKTLKNVRALGFDSAHTSYATFTTLHKTVQEDLKMELRPFNHPLKAFRMIKDEEEIAALREAAHLGSLGYDFVCSILKEGISEKEVAAELEIFWKRRGASRVAFESIIAFGVHSSYPHHRPTTRQLRRKDVVLIDIGVCIEHYHSDMTRTHFFQEADECIEKIAEVVFQAQAAALKACRAGISAAALDAMARQVIADAGYGKEFCHSLGHGVGLRIHEAPRLSASDTTCLEEGMVVTIEPGIYLPNVGGVRLEDTVVVLKDGVENLTDRPAKVTVLS